MVNGPDGQPISADAFNISSHFYKTLAEQYHIRFFCCIFKYKLFGPEYSSQYYINGSHYAAGFKGKSVAVHYVRGIADDITFLQLNICAHSPEPFQVKIYRTWSPGTAAGK